MSRRLRLAVSQSHTLDDLSSTIEALSVTTRHAASLGVHLVLFPEAYLGGYPRTCTFGAAVGARDDIGRDQFLAYFKSAVDLGDTPRGAGDEWLERRLPVKKGEKYRGDGTREALEKIARETGVFVVTGLVEKSGGSLYCSVVYVCPREGIIGKRRKVMPTGSERLIWAQGSPSTLRAVTTTIAGVKLTLAAAICWENYMPLLRYSLYSQNVNLYLAPTADARDTWLPLMRTIACEGRAFVLSANQCMRSSKLPEWIKGTSIPNGVPTRPKPESGSSLRRPSIVTKTEDNHEITWPPCGVNQPKSQTINEEAVNGTSKPGPGSLKDRSSTSPVTSPKSSRRVSTVTKTDDNHEITWPLLESTSTVELNHKASTKMNGSSPLPTSMTSSYEDLKSSEFPTTRRKSIIAKTADNHEIVLPVVSDSVSFGRIAETEEDSTAVNGTAASNGTNDSFVSRGGSCIIHPMGNVLAGPLWEVEDGELLVVDADFDDCDRGRLDLDVAGSYSRNDAFRLEVEGLDISPPP